ncbi:MAG TPA: GNAT family N-acetyltransferase [Candidatus Nitrosotenuis sp.]|jgi:glucosamine-phosphate N-acetyltransferase
MTDIIIRKIEERDLNDGFLESLDSLKTASNLGKEKARAILKKIAANPNHVIFVAVLNNKIIGSTTLLIEQKFIHDGGLVGHIEDVVVTKEQEGKGIGFKIMQAALEYAKSQGCYKTILDCDDKVKPFYERLGFKRHSNGMRFDH